MVGGRVRGHTVTLCPAPGCNKTLQVTEFVSKRPEDEEYEAEIKARRYVTSIFNKPESAFGGDLKAYNDYLERTESFIALLVTGTPEDKKRVEGEMSAYAAANHTSIAYYRAQQQTATRQAQERIASEQVARAAAASQAAAKEADKRRVLEGLKGTLKAAVLAAAKAPASSLSGGGGAVGLDMYRTGAAGASDGAADAATLRARLRALQAQLKGGEGSAATVSAAMLLQGAGLAEAVAGAGAVTAVRDGEAAPICTYVPCPAVPLPRVIKRVEEAAPAASRLYARQQPPALRARLLRAGGLSVHEALAWNRAEAASEMWPLAPALGTKGQVRGVGSSASRASLSATPIFSLSSASST